MDSIKSNILNCFEYIKVFLKWLIVAAVVGVIGGVIGSVFHILVENVTHLRTQNPHLIFLLPLGGVIIAAIYSFFKSKGHIDTNRVLEAVRGDKSVPIVMMPLIFISTVITHLVGGSAGREGAALQLGGSIGYNLGKLFKLSEEDKHIITMAGMSSVFSALFGTPLTAAVFALEVVNVGVFHYTALLPSVISALTALLVSLLFEIAPVSFSLVPINILSLPLIGRVIILAVLCAVLSIVFCFSIKNTEHYMKKFIKNPYSRAIVGGIIIIILTFLVKTYDYNGAGMDVISRAISGTSNKWAFLLKIVFTSITIAAGFKGGEIVPTFFIGATFGCVMGQLLGINPGFGAAVGFVSLFCGVTNCPLASILLSVEVFGADSILLFGMAAAISYLMSGNFGLYKSQKIVYSKLTDK